MTIFFYRVIFTASDNLPVAYHVRTAPAKNGSYSALGGMASLWLSSGEVAGASLISPFHYGKYVLVGNYWVSSKSLALGASFLLH